MRSEFSDNLLPLLKKITTEKESLWLQSIPQMEPKDLMTAFVKAPRFLSKTEVHFPNESNDWIPNVPGFQVEHWDLVRLARVWFLTHFSSLPKYEFTHIIETLFDTAELNELVALYSALPLLPYPEVWLPRATDAVRSNMGSVFDAIAIGNPYPYQHFPELAWNQLVLKTIFNGKPIELIYGLKERRNQNLSLSVIDFAKERWAASREIPSYVWSLVSPFLRTDDLPILEKLLNSQNELDVIAASLVIFESNRKEAKELWNKNTKFQEEIQSGKLNWSNYQISL